MSAAVELKVEDRRQITVPNGGLSTEQTRQVATFINDAAGDGFHLKSVAARQKDIGSQRDPHVVTEAVVLTFEKGAST